MYSFLATPHSLLSFVRRWTFIELSLSDETTSSSSSYLSVWWFILRSFLGCCPEQGSERLLKHWKRIVFVGESDRLYLNVVAKFGVVYIDDTGRFAHLLAVIIDNCVENKVNGIRCFQHVHEFWVTVFRRCIQGPTAVWDDEPELVSLQIVCNNKTRISSN